MKKSVIRISAFLGISMFMFGILKFINPFKEWYITQISASDLPLPTFSYWSGQLGELLIGSTFIFIALFHKKYTFASNMLLLAFANIVTVFMMMVAIYVHLHPEVPAAVLPLGIKPPVIPVVFALIAITNLVLHNKSVSVQP